MIKTKSHLQILEKKTFENVRSTLTLWETNKLALNQKLRNLNLISQTTALTGMVQGSFTYKFWFSNKKGFFLKNNFGDYRLKLYAF